MIEGSCLEALIGGLHSAQLTVLKFMAWTGLTGEVHGQPAWPWAVRLSGEHLLIDVPQARRLAVTVVLGAIALGLAVAALIWRRRRLPCAVLAVIAFVSIPWPDAAVVLVPAHPTSFHRSPTGFSAEAIQRGAGLYASNCAGCHGDNGRGQGGRAAAQPVWPPDFAGPLLWRRADGDLLWAILHGVKDRKGAPTMSGFGGALSDSQAWALIDFLKAQSAGESVRQLGLWPHPIAVPDVAVRCGQHAVRRLSDWRGQRLRLVVEGDAVRAVPEDPRLVTVVLRRPAAGSTAERSVRLDGGDRGVERDGVLASVAADPGLDCVASSADAWTAIGLIAGSADPAGLQFIADRQGWLRARSSPDAADWSDDDLLCRPSDSRSPAPGDLPAVGTSSPSAGVRPRVADDGLGALIARMDAEPVRFVKGGVVH